MRQRVPSIFLATVATSSVVALLSAQAPTPAPPAAPAQGTVTFAKDIQPIFEKTCWNCHGAGLQLADLDLSTREGALKGGEHGASISHFRIRVAQSHARADMKPSSWSLAGILLNESSFLSVPLELCGDSSDIALGNGIQTCSMKDYDDPARFSGTYSWMTCRMLACRRKSSMNVWGKRPTSP